MLDLRKLETFRAVAVLKSFTQAAAELGYSQSSVTVHIQALEDELGTRLFKRERFSRNIVLTEAGHRTLEYSKRLLALAEEARAAIQKRGPPRSPTKIIA